MDSHRRGWAALALVRGWAALALVLVIDVAGLRIPVAGAQSIAPLPGAALQGTVTDRATGLPLAGVSVGTGAAGGAQVVSDANGTFALTLAQLGNAAAGILYFSEPDYFQGRVAYALAGAPTVLNETLLYGGAIVRGTVTDAVTHAAIVGAQLGVTASCSDASGGVSACGNTPGGGASTPATTASGGAYVLDASYFTESAATGQLALATASLTATAYVPAAAGPPAAVPRPYPQTRNLTLAPTGSTASITVATSPGGLAIAVDGVAALAPQTYRWVPGNEHTIATTSPQLGAASAAETFLDWASSTGSSTTQPSQRIVVPAGNATYTALFAGSGAVAAPAGLVATPAAVTTATATTATTTGTAATAAAAAAPAGSFTATPAALAYGTAALNVASAVRVVTVTNTGRAALSIAGVSLTGSAANQFSQTNNCGSALGVGASCSIGVVFKATTAGAKTASLNVTAGGAAAQSVALTGTGAVPVYGVSPSSLAFGSEQTTVASAPQTVTVTNSGTVALPLAGISLTGTNANQFTQSSNCAAPLAAGASCSIGVVYKPTAAGAHTATLTVNGGGGAAAQSVALTGTGIVPTYSLAPTAIAFGGAAIGVPGAAQSVTLANTGTLALPLTSTTLAGANANQFAVSNTCGTSVAVGAACTLNVVFKPTSSGAKAATLNVAGGGGAGVQSVALSGTGVIPTYTAAPTALAFGTQQTTVPSAPLVVTLSNTGTIALPFTGVTLGGSGAAQFAATNGCGTSLAAGTACAISVIFTPVSSGAKSATLTVTTGGGAAATSVALTGTGIVPTYSLSPTALAFGSEQTAVPSAAGMVTVTNTGRLALSVTGVALSGTNANQYSATNTCAAAVAPAATCSIAVVFTPTAAGSKTATLSVSGAGGAATQSVALSGTGVAPTFSLAPNTLAFGSVVLNATAAAQSVTVRNTGTVVLPVAGITLAGAAPGQFVSSDTCGSSLAVGASCSISVLFAPTAAGAQTATLAVQAQGGATQLVNLSGTGIVPLPNYAVTPMALAFGGEPTGVPSGAQLVTVTNNGTQPLTLAGLGWSGANAAAFSETDTCAAPIAAGGSCAISVVFTPAAPGAAAATLVVNDANGGSQSVALGGTGTAAALNYAVSPTALAFGGEPTGVPSGAQLVTVTNNGTQPLTLAGLGWSGANAAAFSETDTCAAPIAAGGSCAISVVFTPAAPGAAAAVLVVNDANGGSQSVALGGTGTAAAGTSWVYYDGVFDWPGDYSFSAVPNYQDTSGNPLSGSYDIQVTLSGAWGGWLPFALNWNFDSSPYTQLTFALKPTVANQKWSVYFVDVGDVPVGIFLDPTQYGPAPVVGQWATYTIPLQDLGVLGASIYKFAIQDQTSLTSNTWYVDNVGFVP